MRGIGGPLLCIGDLLSDVGQPDHEPQPRRGDLDLDLSPPPSSPCSYALNNLDLNPLFQENYDQLTKALDGTDHSWTSFTLKLCSTLDTADKLINTTNLNTIALSAKVSQLEGMIKRRDADVAQVRSIHTSLIQNAASSNNRLPPN